MSRLKYLVASCLLLFGFMGNATVYASNCGDNGVVIMHECERADGSKEITITVEPSGEGAVAGATAGAVVGTIVGGPVGAAVGGAVGGLIGLIFGPSN